MAQLQSQLRDKELIVRKLRAENTQLVEKGKKVEEALHQLKREKAEEKPHIILTSPKVIERGSSCSSLYMCFLSIETSIKPKPCCCH